MNPEESIVDKVQSVYYDKKGKYYAKRLDQANKKLEKLQRKGFIEILLKQILVKLLTFRRMSFDQFINDSIPII